MSAAIWATAHPEARTANLSAPALLVRAGLPNRPQSLLAPLVGVGAAASKPYRSVPVPTEASEANSPSLFDRIGPHAVTDPTPLADRRAWRTLTPAQSALAEDLTARAERLHAEADGELSIAEAVAVAAMQLGHFPDEVTR